LHADFGVSRAVSRVFPITTGVSSRSAATVTQAITDAFREDDEWVFLGTDATALKEYEERTLHQVRESPEFANSIRAFQPYSTPPVRGNLASRHQ
jgi:hypothetical protein